jgi:uncharacterized membrane protein YeiH
MNPLVAALLGTITGVGGGIIRDVLLNQVPTVLRFEVYASAALLGSLCMIAATKLRFPFTHAGTVGGTVCFLLRVVSLLKHWNDPRALGQQRAAGTVLAFVAAHCSAPSVLRLGVLFSTQSSSGRASSRL